MLSMIHSITICFIGLQKYPPKFQRHKTSTFFYKHSVRINAGARMICMPCSGFQYFSFDRFEVLISQIKKFCSQGVLAPKRIISSNGDLDLLKKKNYTE
jgi:hypothetical protein